MGDFRDISPQDFTHFKLGELQVFIFYFHGKLHELF